MKPIPKYKRLELLRLHRAGRKVAYISKALNVSRRTVVRWITKEIGEIGNKDAKVSNTVPLPEAMFDENISIQEHISKSLEMLNQTLKNKMESKDNEDDAGLFSKLVAMKLKKFSYIERQKIMYEIDGMFLATNDSEERRGSRRINQDDTVKASTVVGSSQGTSCETMDLVKSEPGRDVFNQDVEKWFINRN